MVSENDEHIHHGPSRTQYRQTLPNPTHCILSPLFLYKDPPLTESQSSLENTAFEPMQLINVTPPTSRSSPMIELTCQLFGVMHRKDLSRWIMLTGAARHLPNLLVWA